MMNIVYLIGVVFCLILVHSVYKRYSANEKQMHYESNKAAINDENINNENSEVDIVDIKYSIDIPMEISADPSKSLGKNKWLYPSDDFGTMERGRAL